MSQPRRRDLQRHDRLRERELRRRNLRVRGRWSGLHGDHGLRCDERVPQRQVLSSRRRDLQRQRRLLQRFVHEGSVRLREVAALWVLLVACGTNAPPPSNEPTTPIGAPTGEWPSQLPPHYGELRGVSRFAVPTAEQTRCAAGAQAFVVFEDHSSAIASPECRYSVQMTRDCWPGRCNVTLTSSDGREKWSGQCRSAKAGDFSFEVTSSTGESGRFNYDLPRGEGSLIVGDRVFLSGRVTSP